MNKANECTCPSGDGSLVHPCPAHPAVEQAGTNVGHGHVFPRADGVKMRCGGPALCSECAADAYRARAALAQPSPAQAEKAEVVARVVHSNPVVLGQCGPLNANDELMTVAQHAASVARWAEMFNRVEQQRDAALAEVERLRQFERICEGLPQDAIDGGWTVQGIRGYAKRLEDQLKAALAEVAGLRSLLNSLLCYVERDIDRMRSDRDKSDNKEIYDRSISLAMERLKAAQNAVFTTEPGCDTAVELAAQTTQAQHCVPEISGIGRDAEHPRAVVLYLRNEPSEEDMRAIQNFLRAISADVLTQAQHSVPVAREQLERLVRILDAHNYAKDAEALMALLAAAPAQAQHCVPEGVTIERDVAGTIHIKVGDFDFIQLQYQRPYTDNASTWKLAERIASLLAAAPAQAQHSVPEVSGIGRDFAYQAWQASRAALRVELPFPIIVDEGAEFALHAYDKDETDKALQQAGIEVK